jgi:signal transduction histidine kinase
VTLTVLESIERQRLFEQRRVALRVAPFAVAYAVAFVLYPFGEMATYGAAFGAAVVLAGVTLAGLALIPWASYSAWAQLTPLALFLLSVGLLREAHGGALSGYAPLVLVPVVWAAVFGGPLAVSFVVTGVGATLVLPVLWEGAPTYGAGELRRAALFVLVSAVVAGVIQILIRALITEMRRRADSERQLNAIRASELHDDVVQSLTVAQLALARDDRGTAGSALAQALGTAQTVVASLLESSDDPLRPGSLRRSRRAPELDPVDAGRRTPGAHP